MRPDEAGWHPGRARPGLIEARSISACPTRTGSHPGRARPGLIEAEMICSSASRAPPHPGRARPGLIEAAVEPFKRIQRLPRIRGARAPASLKQTELTR